MGCFLPDARFAAGVGGGPLTARTGDNGPLVSGKVGGSARESKRNARVGSLRFCRGQALMFGAGTPVTASRKRGTPVSPEMPDKVVSPGALFRVSVAIATLTRNKAAA
jgi:hypothetical protein